MTRSSTSTGREIRSPNLKPMIEKNIETLARAEVEAEHLEREVITVQANLDGEKKTMLSMRDSLKTGDFRLAGHVADTADEVKAELAHRLDHYTYTSELLKRSKPSSRPSGRSSRRPTSSLRT